jgi:hypothetical protein
MTLNESDKRIRWESAGKQAVSHRNYRRARDRALVSLSHLYPDTYKQLLEIEKAFDEQQGKKWIDLDGNTNLAVGIRTRTQGLKDSFASQDPRNHPIKSNNGGEA